MATSTLIEIKNVINMRVRRIVLLLPFSFLLLTSTLGQPTWVPGTPAIPTIGATSVTANYGINAVGTVYIAIWNYNVGGFTSGVIKASALAGPSGSRVATAVLTVTAGNINTVLQSILGTLQASTLHTLYIVAEGTVGGLQAAPVRFNFTTLPCPKIDVLTGFTQPVICINKTPIATFQTVLLSPDPNVNGVLKGTQWTLDWGDGTTATYTSTADNDLPPLALRTHTYSTVTDCNYVFSNGIRNPCGETRAVQYVAVVHGRDIPSDGDGVLEIVDDATGSTTIQVCAGTQTTVTLRDNSTWNCQNPVLPGGLTPVPNTDPRNIEWLYGRDPLGAITNTITGAVAISTLGNAPQASGRLSPIAAPGTLSQDITIPATCLAGQYFRVYLKNWNKCNWLAAEYVNTFVDIQVIGAPPAPTAASRTICFGDPNTLTVTSPPVGTITWYSDALLTTVVGTGVNYVPVQTAPGTYNFWVTDQSTTGLMCMSPATLVTLRIREALTQPGVITGPAQVCSNQAGVIFSVVANPPVMPVGGATQYLWTVPGGWTITAGQGTRQITVTVDATAGVQTVSLVNRYTTVPNCPSPSRSTTTNVNPIATINSANSKTVCNNTPLAYTATSATAGCSFAWTRAAVVGISNLAGAGATALINESLINTTTAPVNAIYIITPTINGCAGTPFNLTVTVNPTAVITSAATKTVCNTTALAYTSTSSTAGATFAWTRAVVVGISNAAGAGAAALINESLNNTTTAPVNAIYIITPSYGGCAGTPFSLTVTVNPRAVITSAATANVCDNVPLGYTATSSTVGATFAWTRAVVAGIANAAGAGATSSINESLDNTSTAPVNVTYIITPSYGGCAGTAFNLVVTVNPTSVITSAAAKTVCNTTALAYTATSSTAGASFSWTRAVVVGISNAAGAGAIALINESLTNTTTAAVNAIYVITPRINGCNGTPFNLTVTVNPTAVITSAATRTVCDITPLAYTATSSTAGATFAWTRAVVAGISNGAGAGATSLINESLDNTTAAPVNATYIITPSYGGCAGTPFNLVVTVNPTAVITSAATANVCDNTPLGYTATSSTAGATFAWTRAVVAGISNGAGAGATSSINESLDNTSTAPVAVTYIITPSYPGCTGTPFNLVVTVNPTAVITSAAARIVCSNVALAYTATSSTAGASFTWTRAVVAGISNGAGAGATSLINESLINTTGANLNAIYIITPSIGGCAGTPFTLTVTVHPQFTLAQLHDDASICNNTATLINAVMTGGTSPFTVNYTKNGVAQAPGINYISGTNFNTGLLVVNTTYALTSVTDNFGCPAQSLGTSILITVGSVPTTATLTGSGNACSGATSTIRSVITGGAPPYTINYTRNGVAQAAITPYISNTNFSLGVLPVGTYNYQITSVTDFCGNTIPIGGLPVAYTIIINPIPNIAGTVPAAQTICNDASAVITLNSTVNNTIFNYTVASLPLVGYSWTAGKNPVAGGITDGDGNGTETLTRQLQHNYIDPVVVTYSITPTGPGATACVGTLVTRTVTVNPTAVITSASTATVCDNTPLGYTATSSTVGATFAWTRAVVVGIANPIGSGATSSINESLDNTTTAPVVVRYVITPSYGACAGTPFNFDVTVNPTAVITSAATKTICDNASTAYTATSSTVGATFAWTRAVVVGIANPIGSGATSAINENLDNTTTAPVVVRYVITPSYGACAGTPFNFDVTVNPTAVITSAATATVCDNTPLGYTATSSAVGATFAWTRAVVVGIANPIGSGATSSINESLDNTTIAPVVVRYVITPSYGACAGTPFNLDVTVNPTAVITSAATKTICDNASTAYTATSSTVGATFAWTRAVVVGIANPIGSGATSAINENLDNTTTAPVVVRYVITPSYGGCAGTPFNFDVTVNPTAVITSAATATVCDNTPLGYTATSSTVGATFAWTRAVVVGIANPIGSGATSAINESLDNTTTAPVIVRYVITPSYGACAGTPFNFDVTVNPTAVITSAATATVCDNTPLGYTATSSTVGATFAWTRAVVVGIANAIGSGATSSINESLDNTTIAPVVVRYVITPSYGACAGTPFNLDVTVNPTAVITSAATKTICDNASTAYTATSSTVGATFAWTRAVVVGIANPIGSGATSAINENLDNTTTAPVVVRYVITPSYGACAGTPFNFDVTVNPTAVITSAATKTICDNASTAYTATSSTVGATFAWTRAVVVGIANPIGSGATSAINENLDNTTTAPVVVRYVITPSIGSCAGTPFNLDVTVNPNGQADQPGNQVLCNGANTAAINFTTVNTGGVTSYSWTNSVPGIGLAASGTGNIASFSAVNAGTATVVATIIVTPTFTNNAIGCAGATRTFTITVHPTPLLNSSLTPADVCSNTLFSYVPTSATAGTTFNWSRASVVGITPAGPTSGINNPIETLRNITSLPIAVTYQYTLAANGCSNTQNVVVNIKPEPVITAGQNPVACSGNALNYRILMNNFTNPADGVTFTWLAPVLIPGNPAFTGGTPRAVPSAANITDVFTNTMGALGIARYTVTPFINGCSGTPVTIDITIGSEPVLDPGLNAFACSNTPIGLILKEAAGSVTPSYYNVISKTVQAGLTDVGNAIIPNGTAPAAYLSTDRYTNTTGVNKTVTYRVQPILAPSCIGAAVDVVITIRPQPVIFPAQSKTVCSRVAIGKEILLTPPNVPAGSLFNWPAPAISDASVQGTAGVNVAADPAGTVHINDQIHNYSSAPIQATYSVTPTSQFGCVGTQVPVIITINPEPVPQPISGRDKICVTDKNIVYNVTAVGGSTFHWTVAPAVGIKTFDFNTNAILIDAAAVPGSGNITVYETNSYTCSGDPSTFAVQVFSVPVPEIITGPAVVCANSTQVYNVTNRAGSVYNWTVPGGAAIVGDPSANSITVIFANVGGTISVRETNAAGCITNHTPKAITVNPLPTATISGGATICDGASRNLSVDFTGVGPYTFTYALNGVPQAPIATASDPYTLNVTAAGTYTIVNVTDANCTNSGTGTTTVSFFPKPTGTISGTAEMCRGASATLTATFTGVAPFTFTYTDGTTPVTVVGHLTNVYTVAVSPLINTTYTLTSLTDGNTCTGVVSGSAVISVNLPPALTLTGTNIICYGVNTGAVNMTIAGGTAPFGYSWTGPSGFTANTQNISALEAGYYAVVVNDSKGCSGTANITLTQPPVLNGSAAGTNITCFGANDGTITVSGAAGGAGTYEFTINGGVAWQAAPVFSSLVPGTYNVMMRDAANPTCIRILNGALLLTSPAVLNATVVRTDVNCFGAANGSIVISAPTGGYGTYGYSINGGATWQGSGNYTNLIPGSYDVRIRDAAHTGCSVILNGGVVITQPPVLSATVNSTNISCFGSTDGTITISAAAGGHGTYEYSINGGGSWQNNGNYINLTPGTYNVQIRDAAATGCYVILSNPLVISQPAVLSAAVASTNITCNGANDGIINITAPVGGYGTYQYSINGGVSWQAAGLFNGLTPGTYDVRIRDAAHTACVIILNGGLQITQPAALTGLVIDTDITCFGANDGIITITNSAGGYGTYQYSINGGGAWQDSPVFPGLIPGTYDVRIRDKAHTSCVVILNGTVVISQPAVLNATVNSTNVTCFGTNDGTITISGPTGGYGSYGYSINGGTSWQGSGNFVNLAPGTYNIRIRDGVNTGCIIALNPAIVITQPAILSATVARTNVTCYGASNGTITINGAAGGYGTYEYTINGGTTWQALNTFTGLLPGFYNVRIRDAVNTSCIVTLNGSLNITEPPILNATVARTNVTCNGSNNGTITISSPTGGYGTYGYSINGGATWQASGIYTNLIPGSYNVQIRDAANPTCIIVLNSTLIITEPAVLAATVTATNVTCFGASNGIITITGAAGGSGSYEYTINGGTTWVGLGNFTNLPPATYDVRIRDAVNTACVITLNGTQPITQPPVLSATVARTNISCFGSSDGTISITAPLGGYGTYEYSINGGGSWQVSGNFIALGPGNYNVQIRDAAHTSCVIVLNNTLQITQPATLNAVVTPTNVTCNGSADGIINITAPVGGYGTYEYSINGGTNWFGSGLFSGLPPATYDVRIRDAAHTGCVIVLTNSLTITEPAVLNANISSANVTCFGAGNGVITISSPTGGYGTYEYSRDGGTTWQATGTFGSLAPGSYSMAIRDKAHTGCMIIFNPAIVITQPPVLSATVASTNVTCFGAGNGTITITNPLGGYGTYGYTINGGATWQSSGIFTNLTPGNYNVRIRDAANTACEIGLIAVLPITQPAVLSGTVASTNVTCSGAGDGTITITNPLGGYGTYEYSVNGGTTWQVTGNFAALLPGFYNVQIRDAAHTACVIILNGSLQITQPPVLSASVASTNVTCNGASNGTITISSPTGGYGTYQYSINGGTSWQATGAYSGLLPGSYNVQIRDAAHTGCVAVLAAALIITEPAILNATVASVNVTCNGAADGTISVTLPTGGYGTYQYSVDGGTSWQGSGTFTNLAPATYNVQIRDAAHTACVAILSGVLVITQPAVLSATVVRTNVSCYGGSDGTIVISAPAGGYGTYEYSINGGGSWQASGTFTLLVPGSYNVRIRDAAHTGCVAVLNAGLIIAQPAVLNATVTPTMVSCFGANDGIINITAPTGGGGTYEFSVNGGTTWQASGLFNALPPGPYNIRIRDAANITCEIILNSSLTITEPAVMNATVASSNITCFGANNGVITITSPIGGYGTFEYSRDGGTTWQATGTFGSLTPGSYTMAIRDKAHTGCVVIFNPAVIITQPPILSGTVASSNITCFGANNGTITVTNPLGGYGTYAYSVNGGATWQASGSFTNLAPNTYNVRIRDAANIACEMVLSAALVITQPPVITGTVNSTNVTCFGAGDGTITITNPLGGYGTYEYSVNGGATWQVSGSFAALLPGFYNVQIRDAANITCAVILNGSLQITQPSVLSANLSRTNVTCNGSSDGTITISSPTGGYGTYQYSINGGGSWQATGAYSGLLPANYDVQIRDAANTGCVAILNAAYAITQPAVLSATVTPTMVSCFGSSDGIITITNPAGGNGTYQYSVNGGTSWQGSGTFTNLAPANYDVRIRDAANIGCVRTLIGSLAVTQPPLMAATISSTNVSCFGGGDGTITISGPSGGYGTYEYSINGGGSWQASGAFSGLTTGAYSVLIRDAAHIGCVVVLNNTYMITQPGLLTATVSKADVSCSGMNDGTITVSAPSGGYGTYEYSVNGGTSWQASGNFVNLIPATYDVRIRDAAHIACSVILYPNLMITEPLPLTLTSTGDILLDCNGDVDGMGTFYASGGTLPYSFTVIAQPVIVTIAFPGFNSQTFFGAGVGTITVQVTDLKGCFAVASVNITQPALLTPGSIAANQVICNGGNPSLITETSAPTGGPAPFVYQWQYSTNVAGPFVNIAGATLNQYTPVAGATTTLYYRRMVTSGGCAPVYSNVIEVLVHPRPIALLTGGETICPAQSSILKVTMPVGTGPFEIDIQNYPGLTITGYISGTDITVTPAATTTYKILRVRDANGCEVNDPSPNLNGTATVVVSALPVITSFTPAPAVCEFTLANYVVTASGTNLTYQWFVNDGSGFNPVVDGGTYFGATAPNLQIFNTVRTLNGYVYHVVVSGCGTDATSADAMLTINTSPELTGHPSDSTVCLGNNAAMYADATGTSITWQWFVNKGAGFVVLTDDANFTGSTTKTLTITNALATFNNWIFRARATGICGVLVFTNFARLSVINPPTVGLQPLAKVICENGITSFLGNGSGYTGMQWQVSTDGGGTWSNIADDAIYSGSGTNQLSILNAPVTFNANQYRLGLIGACTTTPTNAVTLTVNANPVVDFTAIDPVNACGNIPIVLNGNPTGGSGIYTQHRWTGDVGPMSSYISQSPTFNSMIAGTYNLNYRVTDDKGCTSNDDLAVIVDSPSADFTQTPDNGCTPLSVTFTKDMTGIASFSWDFGDGSPLETVTASPVHLFANASPSSIGYYNVKLTVHSPGGCVNSFTSLVTVYPSIDATFTSNVNVVCSGNPIIFTSTPGASKYFWEYGDGVSGYGTNTTNHLYINFTTVPVVHQVKLTTTSFYNCTDVKTMDITVMPVPLPQFTAAPVSQIYNAAGNPVTFTNVTNAGTWNWLWKFGDGTTSTDQNPSHTYTSLGTFNVTLIASNANCSDSVTHPVTVTPIPPVADFDSIPSGCSPLEVIINNTSLNTATPGTTYKWDFGDGTTSTSKNPTYTYFVPGTYRVELIVTGPGGVSMKSQLVSAYPSPKAYFELTPPVVFINDEKVRFFNNSEGADNFLWEFGDGDTSKVREPFHKYMEEGEYDVTLWAFSNNGCSDKYILSPGVKVEPAGVIRFSTVFTPNKDGPIERTDLPTGGTEIDQFFFPPIREKVINYKLQIFNRLGVLIFDSRNINIPWNGYYKGKLCPQGVYVWYVEGKYANGKPFKKVGDVTLLH